MSQKVQPGEFPRSFVFKCHCVLGEKMRGSPCLGKNLPRDNFQQGHGCFCVPILPKQSSKQHLHMWPTVPTQAMTFFSGSNLVLFLPDCPEIVFPQDHTIEGIPASLAISNLSTLLWLSKLTCSKAPWGCWSLFLIPPGSKHCASSFWTENQSQQRTQRKQRLCRDGSRPCVPPTCITGLCSHAEVAAAAPPLSPPDPCLILSLITYSGCSSSCQQ